MTPLTRRAWLTHAVAGGGAVGSGPVGAREPDGPKVLRYALRVAETTFDPVQVQDVYSAIPLEHMLEALYTYDHLARPVRLKPLTAAGMPEVSADFRVFTIRVRPGIFFADDPVFRGQPRELVAADYVYSIQRYADPANKSPNWSSVEELGIVGLAALRAQAVQQRHAWNYDRDIPGLQVLDRYTLRIRVSEPRPRLVQTLASGFGAVAREVIEGYPGRSGEHPVGTGPFRLAAWRRSSRIVLERNPRYREHRYDAQPADDDAEGQAILARFKGRRLPMIDRVELSVIEENQPRWLSFLAGEHDLIPHMPEAFMASAWPGGQLSPPLARRGIQAQRSLVPDVVTTIFNLADPVIGGYTPEKVALRRAISLGVDVRREIREVRHGQGLPANSLVQPFTWGFDPHFKTEMSDHDPARAKALLDLYGYRDRDGDGWREDPNGRPLVLVKSTQSDQTSRQLDELWRHDMTALGLRLHFKVAQWPENLKAAQAGQFMLWGVASSAESADGVGALAWLYGPMVGGGNLAQFRWPAFDALYAQMQSLPDGPERAALLRQALRWATALMPCKTHLHRYVTDLLHPWVQGYRRPVFWQRWWDHVDIGSAQV
jgi:ABC-type transport system substrate-binding protein